MQAQSLAPCKVRVAKIGQAGCAPRDTCLEPLLAFCVSSRRVTAVRVVSAVLVLTYLDPCLLLLVRVHLGVSV